MPSFIHPGVYVEEVSYRKRIARLDTTGTAFVGSFPDGPVEQPRVVSSSEQLNHIFGTAAGDTTTGQSVKLFLENGGDSPMVVRTAGSMDDALTCLPASTRLLVIPETSTADDALTTIVAAQDWAERTSAFYVVDPPVVADIEDLAHWLEANTAVRSRNAALYFPQVLVGGTATPGGGAVAGIFVRTDRDRGVWKAPAGTEAALNGVSAPAIEVTNDDFAVEGINLIRTITGQPMIWGARTLSSDPEWKYVPTRRLALLVEESIERGTRWVVFEPNDEPLWAQVRNAVGNFLSELWRDGAFAGSKPEDGYFVRCGRDTMTQTDIDTGRLVMEIGFAPLRPAEFIILRIEQSIPGSAGALGIVLAPMVQAVRKAKQGHTQLSFVGGNGTAKTFAANALAGALEVPLYRIDLSQVVSKYIGETEKNLLRVFRKVEAAGAILFFDEADALFGKWAGATGRHDRYANLETTYLLERINEYPGVVILDLERKPEDQRNVFAFD